MNFEHKLSIWRRPRRLITKEETQHLKTKNSCSPEEVHIFQLIILKILEKQVFPNYKVLLLLGEEKTTLKSYDTARLDNIIMFS